MSVYFAWHMFLQNFIPITWFFFWFVYAADVFCDDKIDLVNVNACKELTKVQKPENAEATDIVEQAIEESW